MHESMHDARSRLPHLLRELPSIIPRTKLAQAHPVPAQPTPERRPTSGDHHPPTHFRLEHVNMTFPLLRNHGRTLRQSPWIISCIRLPIVTPKPCTFWKTTYARGPPRRGHGSGSFSRTLVPHLFQQPSNVLDGQLLASNQCSITLVCPSCTRRYVHELGVRPDRSLQPAQCSP